MDGKTVRGARNTDGSQVHLLAALAGSPLSDIAALGVISLDATRASPEAIAGLVRGQWAIESVHWLPG